MTAMRLQRSGQALGQGTHKALATSLLPVPAGRGGVASARSARVEWERHLAERYRQNISENAQKAHARTPARSQNAGTHRNQRGTRRTSRSAWRRRASVSQIRRRVRSPSIAPTTGKASKWRAAAPEQARAAPFRGAGASAQRRSGAEAQHCAAVARALGACCCCLRTTRIHWYSPRIRFCEEPMASAGAPRKERDEEWCTSWGGAAAWRPALRILVIPFCEYGGLGPR